MIKKKLKAKRRLLNLKKSSQKNCKKALSIYFMPFNVFAQMFNF